MKYYFIINPVSGRVSQDKLQKNIEKACSVRGIEYDIRYTETQGHAKLISEDIQCGENDVIFSVGGDGNLNDVVNGIAGTNKILGVIPAGSGNDFYRTLKELPYGVINSDLGIINGKYFINIACMGLDAEIANNLEIMKQKRWIPVSQRYTCSIIYTFFKYKFKKLKIRFGEESKEDHFTIMTICNAKYYGGGYKIAPHALLDDGFFDMYLVSKMPKILVLGLLIKLKLSKHESSDRVTRFSDNAIQISSEVPIACNVDGEVLIDNNFKFEIKKNAIRIFNDTKFVKEIMK